MTTTLVSKSPLRYWALLAIALGFIGVSFACDSVVFSSDKNLDELAHATRITLTVFDLVLVAPRLISLAITCRDIPMLKAFFD